MTDEQVGSSQEEPAGPVVRDKRRIDPETGDLRSADAKQQEENIVSDQNSGSQSEPVVEADGGDSAFGGGVGDELPGREAEQSAEQGARTGVDEGASSDVNTEAVNDDAQPVADAPTAGSDVHPDTVLAAERLADLQRLQAEYVNYKRRVDRDREQLRNNALAGFVESLLPVLDEIHLARQHGDLAEGTPFAKIAEKLDGILGKYGLSSFGEAGDAFDPMHHEALMHVEAEVPEGSEGTTVVQVMQPGYKVGERVVRPARVAVADPQ